MASLAELSSPELFVTLRGKQYNVHPIDGYGFQLINGLNAGNSVAVMYKVGVRCLKGAMTPEEVFGSEDVIGLTPEEIKRVVEIASGQVEQVTATLPNGGSVVAESGEEKNGTQPLLPESPQPIQLAS